MVVTPEHAREAERAVLRWEGLVCRGKKLTHVATPAALSNWGAGGGILQVLCTLARSWWRLQPCYLLTTLALWCCYMSTKGAEVLEGLYSTSSQSDKLRDIEFCVELVSLERARDVLPKRSSGICLCEKPWNQERTRCLIEINMLSWTIEHHGSRMPPGLFFLRDGLGSFISELMRKNCVLYQEGEILNWERQLFLGVQNSAALRHVSHGTGGSQKPEDWFILQRCSPSPVKCKHCTAETVRPKTCSKDWGREVLPGIFLGKDVGPVLRHLNDCKRVSVFNQQSSDKFESMKEEKGRKSEEYYNVDHQVIHGHAEWYVGQLASAVRRGLWKTRENASAILLSTPPHELWHTLLTE